MGGSHIHAGHRDGGHHDEGGHGSVGSYVVGFGLSLVLTLLPFWLVMTKALPAASLFPAILALGGVQIVVHMLYFLHVRSGWAERWELRALVLTAVIVAIVILGSVWVLKELNDNMMPMSMPMGGTSPGETSAPPMHMHHGD